MRKLNAERVSVCTRKSSHTKVRQGCECMERGCGGWSSSSSSPSAAEEVRSAGEESETAKLQRAIMLRGRCLGVGWVDKLSWGTAGCVAAAEKKNRGSSGTRRASTGKSAMRVRRDPTGWEASCSAWLGETGWKEACCNAWLTGWEGSVL